jgi:hypothetical protein
MLRSRFFYPFLLALVVCTGSLYAQGRRPLDPAARQWQLLERYLPIDIVLQKPVAPWSYPYNKAVYILTCNSRGDSIVAMGIHHSLLPIADTSIRPAPAWFGRLRPTVLTGLPVSKLKGAKLVMEVTGFNDTKGINDTTVLNNHQLDKYQNALERLLRQPTSVLLKPMHFHSEVRCELKAL